jgi:hypothetical protein
VTVDITVILRPEGLSEWKIPMRPVGTEPHDLLACSTVAQNYATAYPQQKMQVNYNILVLCKFKKFLSNVANKDIYLLGMLGHFSEYLSISQSNLTILWISTSKITMLVIKWDWQKLT